MGKCCENCGDWIDEEEEDETNFCDICKEDLDD